jgi:hypothetical protein
MLKAEMQHPAEVNLIPELMIDSKAPPMVKPAGAKAMNIPNAPRVKYYVRVLRDMTDELGDNASISSVFAYSIEAFERYLAVYSMEYRHLTRFLLEYMEINMLSRYQAGGPESPIVQIYVSEHTRKRLDLMVNQHLVHLSNLGIFETRHRHPKYTIYAILALCWTVYQFGYSIPLMDGDNPYDADIPQILRRRR